MNGTPKDIDPASELREDEEESTLPELDLNEMPAGALAKGRAAILNFVKHAPSAPGVYRMIDAKGAVLYVGKAKNIKKRVTSYTRPTGHDSRITRMIAATVSMEFISTATETEALLLEANLIKRLLPRFNVLLRDDKSFPYILITSDHWAPQILKHRGARTGKGHYYGPFANAGAVNRTLNTLERAFLLRSCSDSFFEARTRPCLLHQIKRCSAPCTGEIDFAGYSELVREASAFLSGRSVSVHKQLAKEMDKASAAMDFERAASFRDRLAALSAITSHQGINPRSVEEADVFAAHQAGGYNCVEVFFFRTGQNWGNRAYFPKADRTLGASEVLGAFMAQFYDDKPPPRLILVTHDFDERALLAQALSIKSGHKVEIGVPQRGERKELAMHALANAREALGRKLAEGSSQRRLLEALAERFGMATVPRRIEVFDNSHIQGASAVGAMIVAGPEGFVKGQYRKFNIKSETLTPGDDYAMMREVLARRFKRLALEANGDKDADGPVPAETTVEDKAADLVAAAAPLAPSENTDDDAFPDRPDLVLIDGGAGQLAVAREVLADLGLHEICLIGIAKGPERDAGREHFHLAGRDRSLMLEPRDPVLYFVQRLRDEAHRFAIGTHRTRRSMAMSASPLDEIAGIGPRRRRALMKHFGSAKAVSRAGVEDLKAVDGISAEMAQRIYDHFHERAG